VALARKITRSIGFRCNAASRKDGIHAWEDVSTKNVNNNATAFDRAYSVVLVHQERKAIILDPLALTQLRSQSDMDCFEPSDGGDGHWRP